MFISAAPGSFDPGFQYGAGLLDLAKGGQVHALVEVGGYIVGVELDAAVKAGQRLLVKPIFFLQHGE